MNAKAVASVVANMPYIIQMWPTVLLMKLVAVFSCLPLIRVRVSGHPTMGIPNHRKFHLASFVYLSMNHIRTENTSTIQPHVISGVPAFFSKSLLLWAMASLMICRLFSGVMLFVSIIYCIRCFLLRIDVQWL